MKEIKILNLKKMYKISDSLSKNVQDVFLKTTNINVMEASKQKFAGLVNRILPLGP